ncbi:diaminopimelate decarboxylase [Algihabitans sp.]|uniref:diaminopimelate decarboxylase n=1 Tax=Algihabitans sp. TaxID=2821514 RepID=UPI003BA962C3
MSSAFLYRDGGLSAGPVPLAEVAAAVGTPAFVYSADAILARYRAMTGALAAEGLDATVCYAVKANPHLAVVRTLACEGAGADVVSEGELLRARTAGVPGERIVFAGVGKTEAEMAAGLEAGILQFNVESEVELQTLDRVARDKGVRAPVSLRINPDVDARTHAKITTGTAENKFGIDHAQAGAIARQAADLPGIDLTGLAVHIGSQLVDLAPYALAFEKVAQLFGELRGGGLPLRRLDLGGGIGISYRDEQPPAVADYARVAAKAVGHLGVPVIFEPGRWMVGDAGLLLTRVIFVKRGVKKSFVIVDAAMNDLIRPTLYDAWHDILPVAKPAPDAPAQAVDIVGPICESGDLFATDRALPPVEPGDLLAICSAGAYGATMASTYNSRLPAPEVLVAGADWAVIKARPDHATLLRQESLPAWLAPEADLGAEAEVDRQSDRQESMHAGSRAAS